MDPGGKVGYGATSTRQYQALVLAAWTLTLGASLAWNLSQDREAAERFAAVEARAGLDKDLVYRRWVAGHGGVYVRPTREYPPNPWLADLPDRDVVTTSGLRLTLVNPAYMTRQVHALGATQYGIRGHITSLNPIRPENGADAWETAALERIARGNAAEVVEVTSDRGAPALRLMGRLVTEARCLKCHEKQGYKEGDVRGGISVTVPLAPYLAEANRQGRTLALWHLGLWAIGAAGVWGTGRRALARAREREAAKAALLEAEAQLAQKQRLEAVGQLAGGVAHDLNNLLAPILGHASMALEEAPPGSEVREDLEQIRVAAERARDLTHRLLAFARKQPMDARPTDLARLVSGVAAMIRQLVGERIRVETRLEEGLPASRVDRSQIEVALINLAANARDAMPGGGALTLGLSRLRLEAAAAHALEVTPGDYLALEVRDSGTGLSPEAKAHLFEPFFTTKPLGKGTGLGLAGVLGVVRRHGGAVQLESTPGEGTVVRVLLPACDAPAEEAGPGRAPLGPTVRGSEEVLVCEDDEGVRRFVVQALEAQGYAVTAAPDAEHALAVAGGRARPFDLLFTDVVLPGQSGRELALQLVSRTPGLRVVYMTGYPRDVFGDRATPADGAPLLVKPFTAQELARTVRSALDAPRRAEPQPRNGQPVARA